MEALPFPAFMQKNHFTQNFASEFLKPRHPDLSEPFPREVIVDEVAVAYGRRDVPKLVDLLMLAEMPSYKRAQALRVLLGLLSTQETKVCMVKYDGVAALLNVMQDAAPNVQALACQALGSLAQLTDGRAAMSPPGPAPPAPRARTALDALYDAVALRKHHVAGGTAVQDAACEAVKAYTDSSDGSFLQLVAPENIVPVLVEVLKDVASTPRAKAAAAEALSNMARTDDGVKSALRESAPVAALAAVATCGASKTAVLVGCASLLSRLCQLDEGKIDCYKAEALPTLADLLGLSGTDAGTVRVRALAASALQGMSSTVSAKPEDRVHPADVKLAVMQKAGAQLVALLEDPDPWVAANAMATIQSACEDPRAARILDMLSSEKNIEVQVDKPVPYMGSMI